MSRIISITGVSGSGKTTIAKAIIASIPGARMVTSYTTRERRPSDIEGEYCYLSKEQFAHMDSREAFLWTAGFAGDKYGTVADSISMVCKAQETFGVMILVPEVIEMLRSYLASIGELSAHTPVFILPPPKEVLYERLYKRGDTSEKIGRRRMEAMEWETNARESTIPFHFIRNDGDVRDAVQAVSHLLVPAVV